jgi:hypothetical protein
MSTLSAVQSFKPMASLPDLPQTEIAIVEMTNAFRKDNWLARSSRTRR